MAVSSKKVVSGFSWVALSVYSNRVLGFITTLILAKFLTPDDFGLVAIAAIVIQVLRLFKDMGLSQAIIYNKGYTDITGSTAFIMVVGLNVFLFVVAAIIAPFAAKFYDNPTIMPIIILVSSNLVWNAIKSVPYALIRKEIEFKQLVVPDVIPVLVASVVSIVMAIYGFGVWSLVARSLLVGVLGMILIWKFTTFRPKYAFDKAVAKELFNYGKYIVGASIVLVGLYNIDKFYISKLAGLTALGFYELAMRIANLPVSEFSHVVGSVIFPVLSKINDDMEKLKSAFLTTLKYVSMISIPIALGVSFYGPTLVSLVYGSKWEPMSEPLKILAGYALFRALSSIIHDSYKAVGKPGLVQKFAVYKFIIISVLGFPILKLYGMIGMCWLIVGTYSFIFIFEILTLSRMLNLTISRIFLQIYKPFILSLILIPGTHLLLEHLVLNIDLLMVLLFIAITIGFYVVTFYFMDKSSVLALKKALVGSKTN